ncbi:hypothetical protein M378DRAFT_275638 [Amanita muscaria Koide BX008]|uniref:DUF6533 domain-containing protein n=1 Tax=Amanita muscaria (strain Koide BX008) TaxID=946122 RepID=A0A0C2WR00_AMAMK|nr:hypothetical protein M378DRAFT_275638 [Amanita muscaria Koide BX008]
MADAYYDALITGLRHGQFYMYVNVATLTVWAVDYIATLDYEIEYMWPPKFNLVSLLFLLTRYMPIADMIVTLYTEHAAHMTVPLCTLLAKLYVWLIYAGMAVAEALLTFGTKIYLSLSSLEVMIVPIPGRPDVCFPKSYDQQLYLYWVFMIVVDAVSCVMLLMQLARAYKTGGLTNLMRVVYQDGVIFYLVLLCFSVVNIFAIVTLPAEISSLLTAPERILHAVLAGRVILNTRHQVSEDRKTMIALHTIPSFDAAHPDQFSHHSLPYRGNYTSPIIFSSPSPVSFTKSDPGCRPPYSISRNTSTKSDSTIGSTASSPGPIFEAAVQKQKKRQRAKMRRLLRMAQRSDQRHGPDRDPDPHEYRISTVAR